MTFARPVSAGIVVVTRPSAIAAIQTGGSRAWSIGCAILDLEIMPGVTYKGEQYDGELRDIEMTHLGLVRVPRRATLTRISYP